MFKAAALMSEEKPPSPPERPISGLMLFFTVFPSVALPMFMAGIDQTMVATAVPAIVASLGGVERGPWIVVAYLLAATISAPVYGLLGDALGRLKLIRIAVLICMTGSVLSVFAPTIETLMLTRVLQGLGAGGLMTLSHALIGEAMPARERARYQGYISTVMATSASLGPVVGSYLVHFFGWQAVFLVQLPLGLLALALSLRLKPRSGTGGIGRFDGVGLTLFACTVIAVLTLFDQVRQADAVHVMVLLAHAMLSVGLVAGLLWWEKRVPAPVLPIRLMRDPVIWRCDALAATFGGTQVALVTMLPIYLRVVGGVPLVDLGLLMMPLTIGIGFGSTFTGWLMGKTGHTALFPSLGLVVAALTLTVLAFTARWIDPVVLTLLFGTNALFLGMVMPVVQVAVQHAAGAGSLASAAASVQIFRNVGAAAGTAIASAVLFAMLRFSGPDVLPVFTMLLEGANGALASPAAEAAHASISSAFTAVFLTLALVAVLGALTAWTIPVRRI